MQLFYLIYTFNYTFCNTERDTHQKNRLVEFAVLKSYVYISIYMFPYCDHWLKHKRDMLQHYHC